MCSSIERSWFLPAEHTQDPLIRYDGAVDYVKDTTSEYDGSENIDPRRDTAGGGAHPQFCYNLEYKRAQLNQNFSCPSDRTTRDFWIGTTFWTMSHDFQVTIYHLKGVPFQPFFIWGHFLDTFGL